MNDYLAAVLFFLPAAVGNATPVFINHIPWLNRWDTPMDLGKKWRGQRLLGDNKRLRGLVFGSLVAGLTALLISKLNTNTVVTIAPFWAGFILGFGALFGDAVESFFKRQRDMKPGQTWFPFDQLDYIVGGLLAIVIFVRLPFWVIITDVVIYFLLHLISTYIGYQIGLRDKPI